MDGSNPQPIDLASARMARSVAAPPVPMPVVMASELEPLVASLYRTEDIAVAPDGRRVVIPGFFSDHMLLADLDVVRGDDGATLHVGEASVVQCDRLRFPHGVAFLDHRTVLVANRGSELMAIDVPERGAGPTTVFRRGRVLVGEHDAVPVDAPSSLAVRVAGGLAEVLVCNNGSHTVNRYVLDLADDAQVIQREVLIGDGLSVPDGIAISRSGRWLAISNHDTHEVFVYSYEPDAAVPARRVGTLRGANYPHGVRFADGDRAILLNDAGLPYLYAYAASGDDWSGVRDPARTLRVMDDATFNSGRYNPQEGGPKGMAVLDDQGAIVQTSTHQHLACLLLDDVLAAATDPTTAARHVSTITSTDPTLSDLVRRSLRRVHETHEELAACRQRVVDLEQQLAEQQQQRDAMESERAAAVTAELETLRAELAEATERVMCLGRELDAAHRDRGHVAAELAAIRRSTSWRITKPVRALRDAVRYR